MSKLSCNLNSCSMRSFIMIWFSGSSAAILRRIRALLDGLAELFPRPVGFQRAAVYAAHNPKWHRVVKLVLVSAGNVLVMHF